MNTLETEWWALALPPEWWAEAEGETVLIGDRDGVGCIEVSTLCKKQGTFSAAELAALARDEADAALDWQAAMLGEFTGLVSALTEDGSAIRQWYVASGPLLLFITYSCDEEHRGLDDAAVDELLDTLSHIEAGQRPSTS